MLPFVPVVVVSEKPFYAKALESEDVCIILSPEPVKDPIIALVDMSVMFHEIKLV
jgi:hypothetical protein